MPVREQSETLRLLRHEDIVRLRQLVRARSEEAGFSLVEQTKLITAASEIARNAIQHGGGGEVNVVEVETGDRTGLRLEFTDRGRGIADIDLAMRDGYTTANGLGLGLGGSKRLVDQFSIESEVGKGTRVVLAKWHA
jgi:serine/threonine-protein kinase RsbT